MSSVKAVLRTKANINNLYPIAIRVTKDRKASFLYVGQYIKRCQWDRVNNCVKKSHNDALNINQLIFKKLSSANKKLIEAEIDGNYQSVDDIKNKIVNSSGDFFAVSLIYLKRISDRKKFHQLDIEYGRIQVFKEFLNRDKIYFREINIKLIRRFDNFLINKRKISSRTVSYYMIMIRTIFNIAISELLTDAKCYPFGKGRYQIKFPETQKIGLNSDEIKTLETIDDLTKAQDYALSAWLLSFYFAGIRISDVLHLKWKDFVDNRLYYRMGKNKKIVSLQIPDKARRILQKLNRNKDSIFVFKELENIDLENNKILRTRIKTITRNFNRRLEIVAEKAGIDKKISMHIARHSFGNISGDKIPIQILQKLYRHSSVTTTILYQSNFIQKDIDNALEKVLNL
ncbi:site-specific integrase [Lacinutrix algicola]|uniref:site-specific integrase n=1 Tax=Lacinutrix algicola TaxID=342954 RepID=UPI0006E2C377|nr:site-specific integrase [Lacinutrix algicola]